MPVSEIVPMLSWTGECIVRVTARANGDGDSRVTVYGVRVGQYWEHDGVPKTLDAGWLRNVDERLELPVMSRADKRRITK